MGQILAQHDLGNTYTITRATYHNGVVMGAPKPEHHPEVVLKPALRKQHLLLIPNPANVVLQVGVLSDIIEAGRHGHVNHRTSLAGIVQKRGRTNHLKKESLLSWPSNLTASEIKTPFESGNMLKNLLETNVICHRSSARPT